MNNKWDFLRTHFKETLRSLSRSWIEKFTTVKIHLHGAKRTRIFPRSLSLHSVNIDSILCKLIWKPCRFRFRVMLQIVYFHNSTKISTAHFISPPTKELDILNTTKLNCTLTINMEKSGACPVIPNTVVFRYFSCPAKSMNVITCQSNQWS